MVDFSKSLNNNVIDTWEDEEFIKLNETVNEVVKFPKENLTHLSSMGVNLQKYLHTSNYVTFSVSFIALFLVLVIFVVIFILKCKERNHKNKTCCIHSNIELKQPLNMNK